MLTATLALLAVATPQGPGTSTAAVVINEFSYDDQGANVRCFVELYNRTAAPVDISGWVLQGVDGTSSGNAAVTIPAATSIAAGGFFVVGHAESVPPLPNTGVPNVDFDVPGSGMTTMMETGADGIILMDAAANPIDGVAYEYMRWSNPIPSWLEGDGLGGDVYNPDSNPQSASRALDGLDNDDNGCDFRISPWSPGLPNASVLSPANKYSNDFDDALGSTVDADFNYSFVAGTTADPAALGIAASPQGGNCSTWHDPTGGGDANFFKGASRNDWVVESYVYLYGPQTAFDVDDAIFYGIGVRGSTDSFGEPSDINGLYTYAANSNYQDGSTGIAWYHIVTAVSSDLYLIDFNNGGGDFQILATHPVTTDGWVRVRLAVLGGDAVLNVGGTYGCDDGTRYTASGVTDCNNGVYIQYREWVSASGAHPPMTLDALQISGNVAASTANIGTGSPTNTGTPAIAGTGLPTVGNLAYSIDGSNLVPSGISFTTMRIGQPLNPGVQIPGAPIGALLYLLQPTINVLQINSAGGTSSTNVGIPCSVLFTGLPILAQIVDVDFTMAAVVPVGLSDALISTVGN